MTKSKKSIVMRGALLRPLVIGQGALLHASAESWFGLGLPKSNAE